jgi:hypothetical protein
MKHNEHNLNKIIKKPLKSKRNRSNLLYKNYIYNLFQYNEKNYKKKDSKQKFKAIIKSNETHNTPNNTSKKHNILYTYTNENIKNSRITSNDLKKLNHDICLSNICKKKFIKSRNDMNYKNLIKTNYSSINKVLTVSGINNTNINSTDKFLFLGPISKKKVRTEIINSNRENKIKENIILNKDKNNTKKRLISVTYRKKLKNINDKKNNGKNRPNSIKKPNRIKVTFFRDFNDMSPRNRFNMLRKNLLVENTKINKMFMKFQKQISQNQLLINRFVMSKKKESK